MPKNEPVESFEDLLGPDTEAASDVEEIPAEKTAAQKRIDELKATLEATPEPEPEPVEEEISDEEKEEIKNLEDQIARRNNARLDSREPKGFAEAKSKDTILIHFVEDGFSAFGTVWNKGQELEISPGSPEFQRTQDINGDSWLDLRTDNAAQRRRWGKVMFAEGPYEWVEGEEFDVIVARADVRRKRGVPLS